LSNKYFRLYINVYASQIFEDDPDRLQNYNDFERVYISETYETTTIEQAIADAMLNWDISKSDIDDWYIEDEWRDLEIEYE
jgi:hypothetical protein